MTTRLVRMRALAIAVLMIAPHVARAGPLGAQQPVPQDPVLAPYRAPTIALVQPPAAGSVPADRPVVVFRFAAGEPSDPIDAGSFSVLVDGRDRRALFQLSGGEAWGPLGDPAGAAFEDRVTPGAHQVEARICSARGTCGSVSATVVVRPGAAAVEVAVPRRSRVLDALLAAMKKLLVDP